MKKRTARWEKRTILKITSNRRGKKQLEHPQVRREMDRTEVQLKAEDEEPPSDEQ